MSRTLTDMVLGDAGQKSAEPLLPGARDLLELAGLGDVAEKHDLAARDEKAADALLKASGTLPGDGRLPDDLRAWMADLDQPAQPTPAWSKARDQALALAARGAAQAVATAAAVDPYKRLENESREAVERTKQKDRERMEKRWGPIIQD